MSQFSLTPRTVAASAVLAVLGWVYWPMFRDLYEVWTTQPDYSHGLLVPLFSLYLLTKRDRFVLDRTTWPLAGFATMIVAMLLRLAGSATSFLPLEGLSLILCLVGLTMLSAGHAGLRKYWPPIVFLVFMIPLPYEASRLLGAELQKLATIASTFLLQCCGLPAISEGNRILIEDVTLNVVEACSGLRMLVTFAAFCVAAVLVLERHWLVKLIVLASAVPIALATNILRIVATGLANVWLHEGSRREEVLEFLHDFNGWMMMPVGLTFLLLELWLLKHLLIERPVRPGLRVAQPSTPSKGVKPKFVSVIRMP